MDIKQIIKQLSLEEKASLCSGKDFWHLKGIERLNLPEIMVTDGPHGLRKQENQSDHIGLTDSVKATCFPTASALASSWDNDLLFQVGEHLGDECLTEEVSVLLGPGVNIKRHPLCGRNFEYFSEDPLLSGTLAANYINGVQSKGIGTSLKHFVANNQETMRMVVDTFVDERTLRELYLKSFEIAVKESQPWTVMCSYNKLNGTYLSENKKILQDILKDEWKHQGLVVTDWGACNDRVDGLIAGQELEMPSSNGFNDKLIVEAVKNGILDEKRLDERVSRIVDLILKSKESLSKDTPRYDKEVHHDFARKVATESMVLLKNENKLLPLSKSQKITVIGEFAKNPRYQGSGSSLINPTKIDNAYDAFFEELQNNFSYAQGYKSSTDQIDVSLEKEAIELAKQSEVVVLMVGLTDIFESEGFDRTHLNIPNNHLHLIDEVLKVQKNVVIVLSNGSPVAMPFKDKVQAILEQYLGGQASGSALVDVLFGRVNPSGKLAETFPNSLDEFPSQQNFPGLPRQVEYREGLYVGYRYYDTVKQQPLFPFGFGLSYTTFSYNNLKVELNKDISISLSVKNTGEVFGKEIVQVYISKGISNLYRPEKELKGYQKVSLEPQEEKEIQINIPKDQLGVYYKDEFAIENGPYTIFVGSSSRDIHLTEKISLTDGIEFEDDQQIAYKQISTNFAPSREDFEKLARFQIPLYPKKKPYTMNSTIGEIQGTLIGKILHKTIKSQMKKMFGENESSDAMNAMIEAMIDELPLRSLVTLSDGVLSNSRALGLIDLMNKRLIRGMYKSIKG